MKAFDQKLVYNINMFPTIDKNLKQKDPLPVMNHGFDRVVAENTSKMVEILQTMAKSNEHLNTKTERLLAVS